MVLVVSLPQKLNNQILPVVDAGIDFYTLAMPVVAGGTASGGGNDIVALGPVKFEKAGQD